ncbi:6725_t:CDS:2 [Acaulospora morrowiae]|uniref:6725_t:CDS:1 n=1 Tax=Acaulospora morrowiae TaxID=94023 RepID=A0A9N8ZVY9_9GLOM|nr:6725_t:CDS:2 [Acaulospora morrowiae]
MVCFIGLMKKLFPPLAVTQNLAHEILLQTEKECKESKDLTVCLHFSKSIDWGHYNLPLTNEITVILPGDELIPKVTHDIILRLREVDAWAATEQNRLRFLCTNQSTLHADVYQGLADIVGNIANQELFLNNLGHQIILPSTYIGTLGLLEDDEEWNQCLEEAAILHNSSQLRALFIVILTQCTPAYPKELWLHFHIDNGINTTNDILFLPKHMKVLPQNLELLINAIYPNIRVIGTCNDKYLSEQTILSPRNEDVEVINQIIFEIFPGDQYTYFSADNAIIEEGADNNNVYPIEFLNSLNPNGMPLAKLTLR